jgi:hypothetical protein
MPKMIMSIDGVVIKEVQITKDRTTLGRRPYNDVVIDNLAVSGEHAVVEMTGDAVYLEDQSSTNGTYVNGKAIKRQRLQHNDTIEIGKYRIKFVAESSTGGQAKPVGSVNGTTAEATPGAHGTVKVLNGAAAGREVPLQKVVTTIGKPGVAVAAITKRGNGFSVSHVDGEGRPLLNGTEIGSEPVVLKDGDLLELAGTQMQFVQG